MCRHVFVCVCGFVFIFMCGHMSHVCCPSLHDQSRTFCQVSTAGPADSGPADGGLPGGEGASDHDGDLGGHGHDDHEEILDPTVMFHSAPTLMFMAILFHDACGSPRGLVDTSVFELHS